MSYELIPEGDLRWFPQTCDKPYDRHKYKLFLSDGQVEIYDSWEEMNSRWFQTPNMFLSRVKKLSTEKEEIPEG